MWQVGYITPYRIVLLLLIKKFSYYEFSDFINHKFVMYLTKKVLSEDYVRKVAEDTISDIARDINELRKLASLDKFLTDISYLVDWETEEQQGNCIIFQKDSVLGIYVRKCYIEFANSSSDRLYDIFTAFSAYCSESSKGISIMNMEPEKTTSWVSEHNITTFLKAQAEMIETTGKSNIQPNALHTFLRDLEDHVSNIPYIHQTKYLSYFQSKEHAQSLYHLHLYFTSSINKGVEIQYELLNLGILEHKFGHSLSALSAFNEALTAARKNKDVYCLHEAQYWIGICRKNQNFHGSKPFKDDYLNNIKTLSHARSMINEGRSSQSIFEVLHKTSIDIIIKDIENMERPQHLITTLAWLRTGNNILASFYLELAKKSVDGHVEDIEKSILVDALMLKWSGHSQAALDLIDSFISNYTRESEMLLDWRIVRSNLLSKSNGRKRKYFNQQGSMLYTLLPADSEEYLDGLYRNYQDLIDEGNFENALTSINEIYDLIQKKKKTSRLADTLILKAETYIKMGLDRDAIPILQEAMIQSEATFDAKNYYIAVVKLSENYISINKTREAAIMLDCIFPKVLLMNNEKLESNIRRLYSTMS
ncbi:unnamed protein product [Rhizopus stolonifer]